MNRVSPAKSPAGSRMNQGDLAAQVRETHTGVVVLLGERAFKVKKPIATDFLNFATAERREQACRREVTLNRRQAPRSYLGVGQFSSPDGLNTEPVVVMRRYDDESRLASMVQRGEPVDHHLESIAATLARFHRDAERNTVIDQQGSAQANQRRWDANLAELETFAIVPTEEIDEMRSLATRFIAGRTALFDGRVDQGHIVDGHADLLADDIFCPDGELAILDCLEFDDELRYVDAVDDASFLAMDLEFVGDEKLGSQFLGAYRRYAEDTAPRALTDCFIAYRATVRAKVDCLRLSQGRLASSGDVRRHVDIALKHLRSATVQIVVIGGGPGTGKTTLAHALAARTGAVVISTDDVRRELCESGVMGGAAGTLNEGLYSPQNVTAVYEEVLRRARRTAAGGLSVILDGTWRSDRVRAAAMDVADETHSRYVEFTCTVPVSDAARRIQARGTTNSDATPEIAARLTHGRDASAGGHRLDTARPLAESVAEAEQICSLAI